MRFLDLFSGIGGFSLGLEAAGHETVAFCEIDPFCRRVLAKHWPGVRCYHDIIELTAAGLRTNGIQPDAICGGFPCQDISVAGKGAGITGARSGLWSEYARLVGELRPRVVIVENVTALLGRGLDVVLGDLAALGYDAEWHCIPASAVGAPHLRDRIWIVAYPQHSDTDSERPYRAGKHQHRNAELRDEQIGVARPVREALADPAWEIPDAEGNGRRPGWTRGFAGERAGIQDTTGALADADRPRLERRIRQGLRECSGEWIAREGGASVANATGAGRDVARPPEPGETGSGRTFGGTWGSDWWKFKPGFR